MGKVLLPCCLLLALSFGYDFGKTLCSNFQTEPMLNHRFINHKLELTADIITTVMYNAL